jgi:hypothetical protein
MFLSESRIDEATHCVRAKSIKQAHRGLVLANRGEDDRFFNLGGTL